MQTTKICLIGAGRVARVHANSIARHTPTAALAAIVDPHDLRCNHLRKNITSMPASNPSTRLSNSPTSMPL